MSTRRYNLPSTNDERLHLLAQLKRDALIVLPACGLKLRPEIEAAWNKLDMPELRRCAARWAVTAAGVEQKKEAEQTELFS